jgi:Domain of unknown function (DUF4172)
MTKYIYEHPNWTHFSWQDKAINAVFGEVRLMQGILYQTNEGGRNANYELVAHKLE